MVRRVTVFAILVVCRFGSAEAADRLAVLEFFGRPSGSYCSAAGPAMISLQRQLEGAAVLLEYDFDLFRTGRQDRFWATGTHADYLPLVMVGSGYRTSSGQVDYHSVYSGMIVAELARPARAEVTAYWRRSGTLMRTYVAVHNTGSSAFEVNEAASIWVVAYEEAPIGVSNTWVRAEAQRVLPRDLAPGATATAIIDAFLPTAVDWGRMAAVALVEDRPGGAGRYDMVQAAQSLPAALDVTPDELLMIPMAPIAAVDIAGPHVLEWTAVTDVPWLEVSPPSGTVPASATITLRSELRPPGDTSATVVFEATGDSMSFEHAVSVRVGGQTRRATGRRSPG